MPDEDFDLIYPPPVREASRTFWTPVRVAQRAAELLVTDPDSHVLDVGAGIGKLCIVGALHTGAHFSGVECRYHLVNTARHAANRLQATPRTKFVHAGLDAIYWESFDAFYFFNPFIENLQGPGKRLDDLVELSRDRFLRDASAAYHGLLRARPGARVVTYHGAGFSLPPSYRNEHQESRGSDALQLWIRCDRRSVEPGFHARHSWLRAKPVARIPARHRD